MPHECRFKVKTVKRIESDAGIDWEIWTKTPTCECGEEQPTKDGFPRRPYKRFSQRGEAPCPEGEHFQRVARSLLRWRAKSIRWDTLLAAVGGGHDSSTLRDVILAISECGAVSLCEKWNAGWTPWNIAYVERDLLQEIAYPGRFNNIRDAMAAYIEPLPGCEAKTALLEAVSPPLASWDADTIRVAAAIIQHQQDGKESLMRAFSASLGDSKLVSQHIKRVERVLGSIADFGIRRPADMLLIAGHGTLEWPDADINLQPHHGALGFERERLRNLHGVHAENVLFVENKEAFVAVAEGLVETPPGLAVYMAGNFGSTVEHMLRVSRAKSWMWADLDPYGVSFVRRARRIRQDLEPYLMEPHHLNGANCKKLPTAYQDKLSQELTAGGVLQDLLIKIQKTGLVLEHEGQA